MQKHVLFLHLSPTTPAALPYAKILSPGDPISLINSGTSISPSFGAKI